MQATESQRKVAAARRALARAEAKCKALGEWPESVGQYTDGNGHVVAVVTTVDAPDWAGAARANGHTTPKAYCEARNVIPVTEVKTRLSWK